jgi:excisionase family DNA binding protein
LRKASLKEAIEPGHFFWYALKKAASKDAFQTRILGPMIENVCLSQETSIDAYREFAIKRIMTLPDVMTVRQFALVLNVDESTVYRWIDNKVIRAIFLPNMGGKKQAYRIFRSEFARIIGIGLADLAGIEQDVMKAALEGRHHWGASGTRHD